MVVGLRQAPGEALTDAFERYLNDPHAGRQRVLLSRFSANSAPVVLYEKSVRESASAGATDTAPLYKVQRTFRAMFGKSGFREPDIGDHPDFAHLKGTDDTAHCAVTTLFMDIEGSTRLGIRYPLQDVQRIKNAFIRTAIELITSFDGHVHRIMGDAVMAYFGGTTVNPHSSAIDGLNCASVLRLLAERVVAPKLAASGFDDEFGIRIGLDHGAEADVLWSSYGYPQSDEVTATSFFVDIAAKLQHAAGRNQVMLGDSIKVLLDLPDGLATVKTVTQGGRDVAVPFVVPNHTNLDGTPVNYRQFVLQADGYLRLGALGQNDRKLLALPARGGQVQPLPIDAEVCEERRGAGAAYPACSAPVGKGRWIRFTLRLPFPPRLPYTIRCTVTNHGAEALREAGKDRDNHSTLRTIETKSQHEGFEHWEHTAYRGLHYMTFDVRHPGGRFEDTVGVFVE